MDKDLKIFALEYVKLHDRLLKEQKLVIGQFIMEASDEQVKYMLLSGEVKYGLTEENKRLVVKNEIALKEKINKEKAKMGAL